MEKLAKKLSAKQCGTGYNTYSIREELIHGKLVGDWSMVCFWVGGSWTVVGNENTGKNLEVGKNKQDYFMCNTF